MSEDQTGGVSRRDLLKKGAVAGGIVWTAPLVLSATASAQGAPAGSVVGCTTFYRAKWNRNDNNDGWNACETGVGEQDCLGTRGASYTSACGVVLPTQGPPQPTTGGYVIYVPATIDGKTVTDVQGATKGGSGTGSCGYTTGTLLQAGDPLNPYPYPVHRVVFSGNAPNGRGLSHAELTFCT